ncbi:response regulator [Oribacterium sp. WCC10]|uniref:response regulator n=1 Tax=Oribacterium sp. WCC10 TaxID=1855343 RepID=UPI0008E48F06|nr:response regulator [Oribacterium sp. WCC10]SFG82000.1 Signal transduction histidine kinase [Oribacterium sp. WCC10]
MIQKTFVLSRRDEMWSVLQEWEQTIQDKPRGNMFLVFTVNGLSEDKLEDVLALVMKKYPNINMLGLYQRASHKYSEFLRISFCLMEKSVVTPFSFSFRDIDEESAVADLSERVGHIKNPACILVFAAGSSAKVSYPLSVFEKKYQIPVAGIWSADFDNAESDTHYVWQNEKIKRGMVGVILSGEELLVHTELLTGWRPLGKNFDIELRKKGSSIGIGETIVKKINGKKATDIYHRYLNIKPNDAFLENIREFPFLIKRDNEILSRSPYRYDAAGQLYFLGDFRADDIISFSSGNKSSIFSEIAYKVNRFADFVPQGSFLFGSDTRETFIVPEYKELKSFQNIDENIQYIRGKGQFLFHDGRGGTHNVSSVILGIREGVPEEVVHVDFSDVVVTAETEGVLPLADRTSTFLQAITEDLNEAISKAESANKAKSSFLSHMSHEIRTPINAILGMDEMILREGVDSTVRGYAVDIRNAGIELLGIINDILDFSKIESGKLTVIPMEYKTADMLRDLYHMIKKRAEDKNLELILEADPDIPEILFGDEIRIKQIITNILTNAVKYTEKGKIWFRIKIESLNPKEVVLNVSVKDTGIGIKEEEKAKLFSAFERLDEKRNRTIEGTGLGMNITQKLLKEMNSTLEVESIYGQGSTFFFILTQEVRSPSPMGKVNIEERKESYVKKGAAFLAPDARILAVDDTVLNLTVIKALVKQNKINVDTAESGQEAIEYVKKNHYDIIFLDYRMPVMDGIETLHRMKELEGDPCMYTPIICLTANAVTGAIEEYMKAGFDDVITKPIDSELLEKKLRFYLSPELIHEGDDITEAETIEETEDDSTEIPAEIREIDEISVDDGLQHCGSVEGFMSALSSFYDSLKDNIRIIQENFDNADIKNYTIKVHAMKSSARIIGANELSLLAKDLEAAGDAEDMTVIINDTPKLISMAENLYTSLERCFKVEEEDTSDLPELSDDEWNDFIISLSGFVDAYDIDDLNMMLEMMKAYHLSGEHKSIYQELKEASKGPDWTKLAELVAIR